MPLSITKDCPIKSNRNTNELKCANCGENHTASYKQCPIYLKVIKSRANKSKFKSNTAYQQNNLSKSVHGIYQRISDSATVNVNTPSRKTFKEVLMNTPRREGKAADTNQSLGSVLAELKKLFGNINIMKIMNIVKNLVSKIKNETDNFTKFTYIAEAIMELFD